MVVRTLRSAWSTVIPAVLTLASLLLATAAQAELSMTLDRNPVRVNETFTLDIKTDEVDADEPTLKLPDGVQLLRRNTISSRSIVNGKINAERTWRYSLVARQPGDYLLPAIAVGADRAEALSVSVLAADSKASEAPSNAPMLLKASVDQQTVYAQQQLILTVQLLRNVPVRFAQLSEPQLPTALVQKLGEDSEYGTNINGVSYLVIERRYAIFPQQVGELVIEPLRFQGDVSSSRQLSMFGAFDETQPVSLQSQPITITVKAPMQADSGLPLAQLSLTDRISDGPYRVGEPLTWTLTLSVDGALPAQLPELRPEAGSNWRLYPDQPEDNVQMIAGGVRTVRTQKFALVPLQTGQQTLPIVQLPWWRLSDDSAQLATLPSHTLSISPGITTNKPILNPAPPAVTEAALPTADADAAMVIAADHQLAPTTSAWWPGLTVAFAVLWLLTLALWWRQKPRRTATATATSITKTAQDEPSLRALTEACKHHDASAARRHLLKLTGASSLVELAARHQGVTAAAISELNQTLYGPPPQRWQGDALAAVLANLLRQPAPATNRESELPPLYPQH